MIGSWLFLFLSVASLCVSSAAAERTEAVPVESVRIPAVRAPEAYRYKFKAGATNGYRFTYELLRATNSLQYSGLIIVETKTVGKDGVVLGLSGRIARTAESRQGVFPIRVMALDRDAEVVVDERGRVLWSIGVPQLPLILESYATFLFEEFPERARTEWLREHPARIEDDSVALVRGVAVYQGGGPPGYGAPAMMGTRRVNCRIGEWHPDSVHLKKETGFRSWLLNGEQPRWHLTGTHEAVFDLEAGLLRSAQLEATAIVNTPDFLRRFRVCVRAERLSSAELATAVPPAPGDGKAVLSKQTFMELRVNLQGDDFAKKSEAAMRLIDADLGEYASELLPFIPALAGQHDAIFRRLAVAVLAEAGTPEHVPLLLRFLAEDGEVGRDAVAVLKRIEDPRAIEPLVEAVARGGSAAYQAAVALADFGVAAEPAVLTLLEEKHENTVRFGCMILEKIGTERSLERLETVLSSPSEHLSSAAAEAISAIRNSLGPRTRAD